tara:strand:- start:63 stop:659 length:597 start_codon:yes stop_codon:yes gene_type:complete
MKRVVLIRHGKAAMAGKDHERELDEDGIVQADSLKKKLLSLGLKPSKIYTSPFKRAVQTIKPFSDTSDKIVIEEKKELEEIHIPKDEKLSKHQIIEKMWADENFKIGNGMSHIDHFNNIKSFLSDLFENFKSNSQDLVIISHGVLIGLILKFFFKIKFGFKDWKTMTMPDIYFLNFDENNKFLDMKRDNQNIERVFKI